MAVRIEMTETEATLVRAALRNMIRSNECVLDALRGLSMKRASEPGNQAMADQAATRIVAARNILERL